jgi:predicted dehydrogenase
MSTPIPVIQERTFSTLLKRRIDQKLKKPANPVQVNGSKPIGVGLVGAGNFARWSYVPRLKRGFPFKLAAVFDVNQQGAKEVADSLGAKSYASVNDLLKDESVEAVFVCTPVKHHYDAVFAALQAKKHVLCEKPLGYDYKEAKALYDEAQKVGKRHMVHFSHRFIPALAYLAELIHAGVIGQIYHAVGTFSQGFWFTDKNEPAKDRDDAAPWKFGPEGGVVQDLGPHLIDCCRMSFGEICSVNAWTKSFRPGAFVIDDACGLSLTFTSGAVAQLVTSRWATGTKHRIAMEISGSLGTIILEDGVIKLWTRSESRWRTLLVPSPKHGDFLQTFYSGIVDSKVKLPDFWDGLRNNEALEAIVKSAKQGTSVHLPFTL